MRLLGLGLRLAAAPRTSLQTPRRVLLLRPDHLGDVLLTSPAIALLRESLPSAHLSYLVGPWSTAVARGGPAVDSLDTLVYPGFSRSPGPNVLGPYTLLVREAARIRALRFDAAIVFRPDHWWGALLALAAGIPIRVGTDTPETAPLLTHTRSAAPAEHWAVQALELARLALQVFGTEPAGLDSRLRFRVDAADRDAAGAFWDQHRLGGKRVVALQPSAGAPLKRWPVDRWTRLADTLIERGTEVLLMGGPDDGPLLGAIGERMTRAPAASAFGQALGVSAALYQRCVLVVGLDGGGAHLAAAVGTPTLRLYGPAPTARFGPWPPDQPDQRALVASGLACLPCGHLETPPCGADSLPACLLALGVDDVLGKIQL